MKSLWKILGVCAVLCTLGSACGDIIKTRNPIKKVNTPEPEEKESTLYGVCANFHGAWTVQCPQPVAGVPASFQLLQYFCDLFVIHPHDISFENEALTWSDTRDSITLHSETDTLVLEKKDGVRQGTWTRGGQTCTMSWRRNP